ncbi:MAG: transcriptional regulator [Alphaproteobacteria bacterium]|nr:transcriptional regulator [Alphaproteobacteria bacterium]
MIRIENGPHLDDESRAMLASGRANAAVALFVDTLMDVRGVDERLGERLSGAMLEAEAPAAMRDDALARALAAIDAPAAPESAAKRRPKRSGQKAWPELIRLPPRLQDAIREAERDAGWKSIGFGIQSLAIRKADGVTAEVMRIPPGARTPVHTHRGREYTLCLVGGFSDARGSYGPGDLSFADPNVTHQPIADEDGPCYVLALTEAGLQLTGVMGVVQKLLGL